MPSPRPPYSFGKQIPARPPSHSMRWSTLSRAQVSSSSARSGGGASGASRGMLSASHARTRRRNSSTDSVWSGTGHLQRGRVLGDDRLGDSLAVLRGRAEQVAVERDPPEV